VEGHHITQGREEGIWIKKLETLMQQRPLRWLSSTQMKPELQRRLQIGFQRTSHENVKHLQGTDEEQ